MRLHKIRPRIDGRDKTGPCRVKMALLALNGPRVVLRFGMAWADSNRLLIGIQRCCLITLLLQRRAQVVPRQAMPGVELQRFAITGYGPDVVLGVCMGQAQVVMRVQVRRGQLGGLTACRCGLLQLARAAIHLANVAVVQAHLVIDGDGRFYALQG